MFLLVCSAAATLAALPGSEAVVTSGSFAEKIPVPVLNRTDVVQGRILGEWPGRSSLSGRAATGVFQSPDALELELAGFPMTVRVFLEDAADPTRTLKLLITIDPSGSWRTREWRLPAPWQHRAVRLVFEDVGGAVGPNRWVAFTLPRVAQFWKWHRVVQALELLLSMAFEWVLLVIPGVAVALWLSRSRRLPEPFAVAVILAGSGLSGLICFYFYIGGFRSGELFSVAVYLASIAVLVLWGRSLPLLFRKGVLAALALWFLAAIFYASAGFFFGNDDVPAEQIQRRFFVYQLPPDNLLPSMLAEKMYAEQPYRPALFLEYQSSDRPPLQTGLTLLQRRLWHAEGWQYTMLGILLQSCWLPALWVFLRRNGVVGPALLVGLAVPALSQFALVHEIFTWPKLLSAAFGLLALSCFGWLSGRESNTTDAVLGGVALSLAMLSHTGVVMTVIGFAIVTALLRKVTLRWAMILGVNAAAVYLPWVLYQKFYDPPGDALLKLHLAGEVDRHRGLLALMAANYAKLGFAGWLAAKWANVRFLFWSGGGNQLFHGVGQTVYGMAELNFFSLFPALGFANAGFAARLLSGRNSPKIADRMMLVSVASLVVWVLVMFVPESTSIHQGSFAMMILFFSSLALYVNNWNRRAACLLVLLQLAWFVFSVVLSKPLIDLTVNAASDSYPNVGMLGLFFASLGALIYWFAREWKSGGWLSGEKALH